MPTRRIPLIVPSLWVGVGWYAIRLAEGLPIKTGLLFIAGGICFIALDALYVRRYVKQSDPVS